MQNGKAFAYVRRQASPEQAAAWRRSGSTA
jgi:hypothetical protein